MTVNEPTKKLLFDKINTEICHPTRKESKATTALIHTLAVEDATCFPKDLRDYKKATLVFLTREDDAFSWDNTTVKDHETCLDKMATNNPAEAPFTALTQQLQQFGRVLGIHASGLGQARVNGDFERDYNHSDTYDAYFQLP